MREIITTTIIIYEHPINIVEDEVWLWASDMQILNFRKFLAKQPEVIV